MAEKRILFSIEGITESERMLHTPGEFAKKNLLYVQEVGTLKSLQSHKSQRERLDSFLFVGVLDGMGTITTGGEVHEMRKGSCALLNCMERYTHESSKEAPWELMWVHFNGSMAKAYFELFMEHNGQKNIFEPEQVKELRNYIAQLMELQKEKDLESELKSGEILLKLVNECLFTVMRQGREGQEKYKKICNEIRENVNRNYPDGNLLGKYAEKFMMSEEELDACFENAYGITLRDYIVNRRFTAAKELLRFTAKPVKEIIEESGIRNDDLFRRLFKDGEGMSAEEYRMKWSQWVK